MKLSKVQKILDAAMLLLPIFAQAIALLRTPPPK